jgi:hypothetical protein
LAASSAGLARPIPERGVDAPPIVYPANHATENEWSWFRQKYDAMRTLPANQRNWSQPFVEACYAAEHMPDSYDCFWTRVFPELPREGQLRERMANAKRVITNSFQPTGDIDTDVANILANIFQYMDYNGVPRERSEWRRKCILVTDGTAGSPDG